MYDRWRVLGVIAGLILVLADPAAGQLTGGQRVCKTVTVNAQGTGNADITVDSTATGVSVMAASTSRCGATIKNSGTANMRCAPTTITVTSTAGQLIEPGEVWVLGLEGQQAYRCIRATGTSTTATVSEAIQ